MNFDMSGLKNAMDRMRDDAANQGKTLAEKMGQEFLTEMKARPR